MVLQQSWKKNYIRVQQPNQFYFYNQNMGFVKRMDQNMTKYWYSNDKMITRCNLNTGVFRTLLRIQEGVFLRKQLTALGR